MKQLSVKEHLICLDNILNALSSKEGMVYEAELWKEIFPGRKFAITKINSVQEKDENYRKQMEFLQKKGLISMYNGVLMIEITFDGIMKLSKGGFYNEWKKQKRRDLYSNFFWIATPIAAWAGFFLTLYQLIFS